MSATRGGIDSKTSIRIDEYHLTLQKFIVQSGAPNPIEVLAMLLKEYIGTSTSSKFFKAHTRTHVEFASKLLAALSDLKKKSRIIYLIDNYLREHKLKQSGDFFALLSSYFNYYNSAYQSLGKNIVEQIITPNEERLLEQHSGLFTRLMKRYQADHSDLKARDTLQCTAIPKGRLNDFFEVMSGVLTAMQNVRSFLDDCEEDIEIFSQIYQQADAPLKRKILTNLLGRVNKDSHSDLCEFVLNVLSKLDLNNDPVFREQCATHFADIDKWRDQIVRSIAYIILHMSGNLQSEEEQERAVTDLVGVCEGCNLGFISNFRIVEKAFRTLAIIPIPSKKNDELITVIFKKFASISGYPSLLTYPDLFRRVISMLPPDKKASLIKDLIDHIDQNHLSIDALGMMSLYSAASFNSAYTLATEIGIPLELKTKWVNNLLAIMKSTHGPSTAACEKFGLMHIDITAHKELRDKLIEYVGTSLIKNMHYQDRDETERRTLICIALCKSALPDADRENQIDKLLSLLNINPFKVSSWNALENACKALGMINIPEQKLPQVIDTLLSVIKNSSGENAKRLVNPARDSLLALAKEMPVLLRIATMLKLDAMVDHRGKGFSPRAGFAEKFKQVVTELNMAPYVQKALRAKGIVEDVINHEIIPRLCGAGTVS